MTFNKKLVVSAVGASLALGLGMQTAQASMLFPYVVKDANRTTLITVIGNGTAVSSGHSLYVQYWTKSTTDANTAACQPNSSSMTFTNNDIVTFDTAGLLGPGPLFGDTTNSAPLGTSISYAAPRHGYLVVYQTQTSTATYLNDGYWLEVDIANGGAHGDRAYNQYNDTSTPSTGNFGNPSTYTALSSGAVSAVATSSTSVAVPFHPATIASSVFTVTPMGTAMSNSDNNWSVLQVYNSSGQQGAYDRNENGVDGTVPQTVRCVGRLTASQLMPGVVANAAWAATGGWGWLNNNAGSSSVTVTSYASVYQVDTSSAAGTGKFMQNAQRVVPYDY